MIRLQLVFVDLFLEDTICILCNWTVVQDIHIAEVFWYWVLLLLTFFEDDGDALATTNAGRTNSILASSSPVERISSIIDCDLLWGCQLWCTAQIGYLSSWTRWAVIRVPEAPRGCPIAIAPPFTLLLSGSKPRALATARYWGAKASFTWAKTTASIAKAQSKKKTQCKCNATPEGYKVGYIYPLFVFALRFSRFIVSVISALCVTNLHKIHVFDSETSFFKSFCDCRNRAYKI